MKKLKNLEILSAFRESNVLLEPSEEGAIQVITGESNLGFAINALHGLVVRVGRSTGNLFDAVKNKKSGEFEINCRGQGDELLKTIKSDIIDEIIKHFPTHRYDPHFELFANLRDHSGLLDTPPDFIPSGEVAVRDYVFNLNNFVACIRNRVKSVAFKGRLRNYQRCSEKNLDSLCCYIEDLFLLHSKLLVLRIDLGYRQRYGFTNTGQALPYEAVVDHRDAFFDSEELRKFFRDKLDKDVYLGFIWKLEYGASKSWHLHAMVFLNGQMARQDVLLCKLLGERWEEITDGKGLYFNCNAKQSQYRMRGIGLIDHRDALLREGLLKAVTYLVKVDELVRMMLPDGKRAMAHGLIPSKDRKELMHRRVERRSSPPATPAAASFAGA